MFAFFENKKELQSKISTKWDIRQASCNLLPLDGVKMHQQENAVSRKEASHYQTSLFVHVCNRQKIIYRLFKGDDP